MLNTGLFFVICFRILGRGANRPCPGSSSAPAAFDGGLLPFATKPTGFSGPELDEIRIAGKVVAVYHGV
jgi:hypothetical protein